MRLKGLVLAAAVVLLTNAALLALVASNRAGEPEATIELTERELRMTPGDTDNTGVVLTLAWSTPYELNGPAATRYPWFDQEKLVSLGFDCRVPLTDAAAERYYQTESMLYRPAFAVLEYGGESWQKVLERELDQAERRRGQAPGGARLETPEAIKAWADNAVARRSRLVVVDVGRSADELRRQYPDRSRFLVMRSYVGLIYVPKSAEPGSQGPRLAGVVENILPDTVYVPREIRTPGDVFSAKPASDEYPGQLLKHDPRYRVTLAFGRALEPRIIQVHRPKTENPAQ
jgi:hypothetical protein